ncbi:MAG: hypothetical protein AAGC54_01475 [Cyanobacteria bacterium P01_F01_bin.4]
MQSPPLHLTSHTHYYRGGDITIDPSAAIASGVVLQALPGAAIHIGPGACLGAGVVIQAKGGSVVVEAGASLGTSVLIVGCGRIGQAACVGPASTLLNPQVAPNAVVPPNALIGDHSRSCSVSSEATVSGQTSTGKTSPETSSSGNFSSGNFSSGNFSEAPSGSSASPVTPQPVAPRAVDIPEIPSRQPSTYQAPANGPYGQAGVPDLNGTPNGMAKETNGALAVNGSAKVYGRAQVDNLLSALFPHRQPLNPAQSEEDS